MCLISLAFALCHCAGSDRCEGSAPWFRCNGGFDNVWCGGGCFYSYSTTRTIGCCLKGCDGCADVICDQERTNSCHSSYTCTWGGQCQGNDPFPDGTPCHEVPWGVCSDGVCVAGTIPLVFYHTFCPLRASISFSVSLHPNRNPIDLTLRAHAISLKTRLK